MTGRAHMPDLLARIAEAAGDEAAMLVAKAYGGCQLYVPKALSPDHRLVSILGEDRAQKVWQVLPAGEAVLIPMGAAAGPAARRRAVSQMLDGEISQQEAARAVGVHVRTVARVAKKKRDRDDAQGDLF